MRTWIYDGSFEGLLTVLAVLVETGEEPGAIEADTGQRTLFGDERRVATNAEAAERFLRRLRDSVSEDVVRRVVRAGMADRIAAEMPLYRFIRLAFDKGPDVVAYHAHPDVRAINEIVASVGREIHRLKGLLRFRETKDGWLWGPMAPDHNVSMAVAQHFRRRLPRERWIIHDVARRLMVGWDGHDWVLREHVDPQEVKLSERETEVQEWWRAFYREIAIENRIRPRLQAQNMPRRYWPYLIEVPRTSLAARAQFRR